MMMLLMMMMMMAKLLDKRIQGYELYDVHFPDSCLLILVDGARCERRPETLLNFGFVISGCWVLGRVKEWPCLWVHKQTQKQRLGSNGPEDT